MKIVAAIDSFKGSLSSVQAGNAVKEAALKVNSSAQVFVCPIADGGEGTVEALAAIADAEIIKVTVRDPLELPVNSKYCILKNSKTAVIEVAAAAGLTLVPNEKRNPLYTTTYGVGELIKDAIERGCRRFIIGIGGSATNDGGAGMLSALGFELTDKNGKPICSGTKGLKNLNSVSANNVIPELSECTFRIACDVTNPLCGKNGCSAVFAPQKGADAEIIPIMDKWLWKYANIAKALSDKADPDLAGAGAAGGLGFAFAAFTNASLEPGIQIILEETHLEKYIKNADLVITGEGRLDAQTAMGKAPAGVAQLAKKHGKRVIAFAGCVTDDATVCNEYGIDAFFPILRNIITLREAMNTETAYKNLVDTACQVFRLIKI